MMDEGLDTGDMLEQEVIPLDAEETGGSLFDKLSVLGGTLICIYTLRTRGWKRCTADTPQGR